jgi:hypothetical protein
MAKVVFSDEHDSGEIFNLTVTKEEIFSKIFSQYLILLLSCHHKC